jgi:hypothetical protein
MADSQATLNSLAAQITELASTLTETLKKENVPPTTFGIDSPPTYAGGSSDVYMQRQGLIEKLTDLIYLAQGPQESIFNYAHSAMPDAACLNVLNYFNFWEAVPLDGSASFEEIAKHVNLPLDVARRIVKHGTSLRIFEETEPGKSTTRIKHSFRSAPLARTHGLRALLTTTLDLSGGPLITLHKALEKYSAGKTHLPTNTQETAFSLLYSGGQFGNFTNTWELLENDGEGGKKGWRQREFTVFMDYLKEIFGLDNVVTNAYDWSTLGKAKVVDVSDGLSFRNICLSTGTVS